MTLLPAVRGFKNMSSILRYIVLQKKRPNYPILPYCMSVNAILSTGQGHGQVTKGHYIQKSHCGHVMHVLWPILAIEFNGYVSLVV